MTKKVFEIYKWITLILVVCVLTALAIECIGIYRDGDGFSQDIIITSVSRISPLIYITAITVFAGLIWSTFVFEEKKRKSNTFYMLNSLKQKYSAETPEILKLQKKRKTVFSVFATIQAVLLALPLIYLLNKNNFGVENINGDITNAVFATLIPCIFAFTAGLIFAFVEEKNAKNEIELIKSVISQGKAKKKNETASSKVNGYVKYILLIIAIVLIILGIFNDGIGDVYGKAIRICTECIGLG